MTSHSAPGGVNPVFKPGMQARLTTFPDSPDPGDPACLCSLCGEVIEEDELPIRIFDTKENTEYRLHHPRCTNLAIDWTSTVWDDDRLTQVCALELGRLPKEVLLSIETVDLMAVIGALQLACRHPDYRGPSRTNVMAFVAQIQAMFAGHSAFALVELIDRGWDPAHDEPNDI